MAKHDDLLEQALAEIAMEETNRLKAQLHDPALRDAADSLYVRHRSRLLAKLQARKKRRSYTRFFQLAASVLLVIGAWQVFKQPVKDMLNKPVPLTSGAPTFVPATPALLETPTLVPATATAAPTASPSPEPTATPTLAPTPLADAWGGTYFVTSKEKYTLKGLVPGTMHRAEFTDADGNAYTFAEYPQPTLPSIEKGTQLQAASICTPARRHRGADRRRPAGRAGHLGCGRPHAVGVHTGQPERSAGHDRRYPKNKIAPAQQFRRLRCHRL